MGKLPILYGGESVGEADIAQEGLYVRLDVNVKPRRGLWRAWAVGDAGEIPIGTLEPVNGQSAISRRFSRQALSKAGELSQVELRPAVPQGTRNETEARPQAASDGTEARPQRLSNETAARRRDGAEAWRRSAQGQRLFRNARFQRQLRNVREALTRSDGERRRVALLRDENAPFPIPELFCLASPLRIGAHDYWAFSFDRQGWPVL
ncbi:MAG: hypothetical protein IJK52_01775 [Oscillospiraceae bacterium]|nr:hypothetical protein [Oscillospiraceae bacterium]